MSFISYLKEVKAEVVHVSWPTRETLIQHTALVIGISVALGLALGAVDGQFGKIVAKIAASQPASAVTAPAVTATPAVTVPAIPAVK